MLQQRFEQLLLRRGKIEVPQNRQCFLILGRRRFGLEPQCQVLSLWTETNVPTANVLPVIAHRQLSDQRQHVAVRNAECRRDLPPENLAVAPSLVARKKE